MVVAIEEEATLVVAQHWETHIEGAIHGQILVLVQVASVEEVLEVVEDLADLVAEVLEEEEPAEVGN